MNSRALRRLAADHGALHNHDLPPNYLFPAAAAHTDDLTQLDILLAGPTHTPFSAGVWKLHLAIPTNYPQQPPTANFRTPIFHPNVDPQTGGVCVETLKRDWDSKLTLRDILVTISCLLIQPNPDSALNADAGALIQEDYDAFSRRATLMTSIHAVVPKALREAVVEAQNRGQEPLVEASQGGHETDEAAASQEAPARRRRTIAQVRSMRRAETSPSEAHGRRYQQAPTQKRFVVQSANDDVFDVSAPPQRSAVIDQIDEDGDSLMEGEQENDAFQSHPKSTTPIPTLTPRRPHGVPVPLGELIMDQDDDLDTSTEMELEYPPSPRKSPSKSPHKRRPARAYDSDLNFERPEGSRDAARRLHRHNNITPPNFTAKPLIADDSTLLMDVTFAQSPSPRKPRRGLFGSPPKRPGKSLIFGAVRDITPPENKSPPRHNLFIAKSPSSAERRRDEEMKRAAWDAKLWKLCGGDIKRWNRCDFDGEPIKKRSGRW